MQITANDSNHYKFTGKERDVETGLDYFGARYYSNGLGRWVSADWSATPIPVPYADFYDPQTLNLYQFVGGNPASKADPDGHEIPLSAKEAQDIGDRFSRNTEAAIHALKSIGTFLAQANASLAPPGHGAMPGPRSCPTPEQKTQDNKQNNNSQSTNQNENSGGQKTSPNGRGGTGTSGNGRAPSKIDRAAFKSEREAFWKAEAKANPDKYSAENLARMEKGKAPIGSDGHPMELHHVDGTQNGGLEPMTRTDHRLGENYQKNHPN